MRFRAGSQAGGAGLFLVVLLLFLLITGGAVYFFTQHPEGKKIAADLLKRFLKDEAGRIADARIPPETPEDAAGTAHLSLIHI